MIIPVRCFTCGKVIGHLWERYKKEVESGRSPKDVLDEFGITRYCCRMIFLTHVDNLKEVAFFRI